MTYNFHIFFEFYVFILYLQKLTKFMFGLKKLLLSVGFSILAFFLVFNSMAQGKVYYDKNNNKTNSPDNAYFYCDGETGRVTCYYQSNDKKYFEGKILQSKENFEDNLFTGQCTWYFKNGMKKVVKNFDEEGRLNGDVIYYYESGDVDKIYSYKDGKKKDNFYFEYGQNKELWKVYKDNFSDNRFEWELNKSDREKVEISNNRLSICSYEDKGTSRWISIPHKNNNFIIEAVFDINNEEIKKLKRKSKISVSEYCLIFGFKDWANYCYFCYRDNQTLTIGFEYEGVHQKKAKNIYPPIKVDNKNITLKVLNINDKVYYSINGQVVFTSNSLMYGGDKIGFMLLGVGCIDVKSFMVKVDESSAEDLSNSKDIPFKGSGTGFLISENGYIATCYHVVDNVKEIFIEYEGKNIPAKLVIFDKDNDLAILKAENLNVDSLYIDISNKAVDVGQEIFTLGYPLALSGMGTNVKFNDGKISSKTGYNNRINAFQSSIPVQPGNSGSPVFDQNGKLIGVINAKIEGGDNVSYVIKSPYLTNLINTLDDFKKNPVDISSKPLDEKIKLLKENVFLIKVK
ncbi:MAG: hypothetical protein KatS3mg034_1264 [Vicingaceae bacterium]|nr:MAG: hypothetical protein KatS3mg034_1264 [Vicingaceae bacterium]